MVVVVAEIELEVGENFARGGVCVCVCGREKAGNHKLLLLL